MIILCVDNFMVTVWFGSFQICLVISVVLVALGKGICGVAVDVELSPGELEEIASKRDISCDFSEPFGDAHSIKYWNGFINDFGSKEYVIQFLVLVFTILIVLIIFGLAVISYTKTVRRTMVSPLCIL